METTNAAENTASSILLLLYLALVVVLLNPDCSMLHSFFIIDSNFLLISILINNRGEATVVVIGQ